MYYFNSEYENGGGIKPYIYLLILICEAIAVIVLLILVILCFRGEFAPEREAYSVMGSDQNMTLQEAEEFCKSKGKQLPHPKSRKEEDKAIENIENSPASTCTLSYFAYTANEIRYGSKEDDGRTWITIKTDPEVGNDLSDKLNYILVLEDGVVNPFKTSKLVDDATGKQQPRNLLLIARNASGDEECSKHMFKCIYYYNALTVDSISNTYETAKEELSDEGLDVISLVPYDPDQHPRNFICVNCNESQIYGYTVATKYTFNYKYNGQRMGYKSKRFVVVDPEYDCLAYDLENDELLTVECNDGACATCV